MKMILCTIVLLITFSSCIAPKKDAGRDAASEALAKLQKLQAATQVGVNQLNYGPLLIDAKAGTNAAGRLLSDGPLKTELNAAIDAYADAGTAWADEYGSISVREQPGLGWKLKYSIEEDKNYPGYATGRVDKTRCLQVIWKAADGHIEKASQEMRGK